MNEILSSKIKGLYTWASNIKLDLEHYGMGMVILISTWHVSQHMGNVEGSAIVAIIMGVVLGFLNATFALRFFETRNEVRWPSGFGLLFSAGVSVWMQYGFYDEKSDLMRYMFYQVNVNALVFGAWAPIFEVLLGWLYGVRLHISAKAQEKKSELTEVQKREERELAEQERRRQIEEEERINRLKIEEEERSRKWKMEDEEREAKRVAAQKQLEAKIENDRLKAEAAAQAKLNRSSDRAANRTNSRATWDGQDGDLTDDTAKSNGLENSEERSTERRKAILRVYQEKPDAGMGEVAKKINASKSTVSRDIDWLFASGIIHVENASNGKAKTITLNGGSEKFLAS